MSLEDAMNPEEVVSRSPDGAFELRVVPWEPRMSHTVRSPIIRSTADGGLRFHCPEATWSLARSEWRGTHGLALWLDAYPVATREPRGPLLIDLAANTLTVAGRVFPFTQASAAFAALATAPGDSPA